MKQREIIVFGTGLSGKIFVEDVMQYNSICDKFAFSLEKIIVKCCTDTRSERIGSRFCGYEIIDSNLLRNREFLQNGFIVIASAEYYEEISAQLKNMGLASKIIDFRDLFTSIIKDGSEDENKLIFYDEVLKNLEFINVKDRQLQLCQYHFGQKMLEHALKDKGNRNLLKKGVGYFINAFQLSNKREDILSYFMRNFYHPNVERMSSNYEHNRNVISSIYKIEFPRQMDEVFFTIYPLSDTQWCCFDEMKNRFIYRENANGQFCKYDLYHELCWGCLTEDYDLQVAEQLKNLQKEINSYQILNQFIEFAGEKQKIEQHFLEKIQLYRDLKPYDDNYYWMMGHYYMQENDYELAIDVLQNGIYYNPHSPKLNFLLGEVYFSLGQWSTSAQRFLLSDFVNLDIKIEMNHQLKISAKIEEKLLQIINIAKQDSPAIVDCVLDSLSEVITYGRFFPWFNKIALDDDNKFIITSTLVLDRPLYGGEYQAFLGIEGSQEARTERFRKLEAMAQKMVRTSVNSLSFWSVIEGKAKKNIVIDKACLLPIMTKNEYQKVKFEYENRQYVCGIEGGIDGGAGYNRVVPYKPEYLRIEDKVKISSDKDFIVGRPILLAHSHKRKKLVINLLIDSLSALSLQKNPELMPNTMKFFAKGAVFGNVFSTSEWTVPALPALMSGCYPEKTRFYYSDIPKFKKLHNAFKTTAEYMNEKGYYCINFSAAVYSLIYGGIYRGFEKTIGSRSAGSAAYVMQALEHMRCLDETDLFINMHLLDVHDAPLIPNNKMGVYTKHNIEKILQYDKLNDGSKKSAWIGFSEEGKELYQAEMRNTDGNLGILYDYLSTHYQDDEYLIIFHADHGINVEEKEAFILNEGHTKIPLMMRGIGVPQGAIIDDFVSSIDIHAIYAYLCGYNMSENVDCVLPKIFGGAGRDYVVSSSSYPTQTYKMAIRNKAYEYRLETAAKTDRYGNIDMDLFSYEILTRDKSRRRVNDSDLAQQFMKMAFEHAKYIVR